MKRSVEVVTGARLHFGFLAGEVSGSDMAGGGSSDVARAARSFGGVGMMIGSPGVRVRVEATDETAAVASEGNPANLSDPGDRMVEAVKPIEPVAAEVIGPELWRERIAAIARRFMDRVPEAHRMRYRVVLDRAIPPHVGLGSGTQLALAVAAAMSHLQGEPLEAVRLAERAGRGLRSAIGLYGFLHGGLLVDGGKRPGAPLSPLLMRVPVPESWAVVLVSPAQSVGLSGDKERDAFDRLPPMPAHLSARLCQLVLTGLLPAVVEQDYAEFGEALFEFNRRVGQYFAPIQGGEYASEAAAEWVQFVRKQGISAVGQSSWGPTLFAICSDRETADQLAAATRDRRRWRNWTVEVTTPRNGPAAIHDASES